MYCVIPILVKKYICIEQCPEVNGPNIIDSFKIQNTDFLDFLNISNNSEKLNLRLAYNFTESNKW